MIATSIVNTFKNFRKGIIKLFKKGLTVQESMERMQEDGIKRVIVSYRDSAIGKGVLSYENGKFTRLLAIANNPRITSIEEIDYYQGLSILRMILEDIYTLQSFFLVPEETAKRNAESVRKTNY